MGLRSERCGAFTRKQRERFAFTLFELLIVIGIISLLLITVLPAVNSLSKSGGRKGAISNLTIIIEQARSLALSDARNTYVAFTGDVSLSEYTYRSYAVFEDDATGVAHAIQVTKWQKLPTGISFRAQNEKTGTGTCLTSTSNNVTADFDFPPGAAKITCRYLGFDPTGSVIQPTSTAPMRLVIFEGLVKSGSEIATAREGSQEPVRDEIQVGRYNGRAKYVVR